ncbi:MAG: hypothetical protein GY778_31955, partial [bacterium]|nr:hypothetical protein [bacterium]
MANSTSAGGVRLTGEAWVSRFPENDPIAGELLLSAAGRSDAESPRQQITFQEPGKQTFAFDLPVDGQRLHSMRGKLTANLGFITLSHDFEWDNSFISRWHVVGPFAGGKGPRAVQLEPETEPDLEREYVGLDGPKLRWQAVDVGWG